MPATTVVSAKTQFAGLKFRGVPFGGLLGSDVLARFGVVTVDFAGKRLIPGGRAPRGGRSLRVKVLRAAGEVAVAVRATVHGRRAIFLIDTGTSRSTIDSRAAKRFGLERVGKSQKVSAVTCSTTVTPVRLNHWTAGGVKLPTTIALSSRSSISDQTKGKLVGLIGADVMARFGQATINFAGQRVVLGGKAA